jgi:hypothetical protein
MSSSACVYGWVFIKMSGNLRLHKPSYWKSCKDAPTSNTGCKGQNNQQFIAMARWPFQLSNSEKKSLVMESLKREEVARVLAKHFDKNSNKFTVPLKSLYEERSVINGSY